MIEIKVITKGDFDKFKGDLINFYASKYNFPVTESTIDNSAIICLAHNDKHQIVGAIRTISDLSRHAIIVDLFVDENFRKNGLGKKLLISITTELKEKNIPNISLVTEPDVDWLLNFYKNNGFVEIQGGTYLELKK